MKLLQRILTFLEPFLSKNNKKQKRKQSFENPN